MKQNSQWLSHVRTWSNRADATSAPRGCPARLGTATSTSSPPRRTSRSRSGSSMRSRHSMTSRGRRPATETISSPGCRPASAAGDPGATATTRGKDTPPGYGDGLPRSAAYAEEGGHEGRGPKFFLVGPGKGGGPALDVGGCRHTGVDHRVPSRPRRRPHAGPDVDDLVPGLEGQDLEGRRLQQVPQPEAYGCVVPALGVEPRVAVADVDPVRV